MTLFGPHAGTPPSTCWPATQQIPISAASAAYERGAPAAVLGFVLHFCMALLMAAAFYLLSRCWTWLVRQPVIAAIAYGAFLYPFMQFVVLPLSAYPHPFVFRPGFFALNLLVHMFLMALPIALATRRATVAV